MDVAAVKIVERRASFFGDCVAVEGFYETATIAENGGIIQTILRKFGWCAGIANFVGFGVGFDASFILATVIAGDSRDFSGLRVALSEFVLVEA